MLTRTFYPGAAYPDALPTGEQAMMILDQRIDTHLGPIPFPPGEPWGLHYIAVTNVGGFKLAGLAHSTNNRIWEWTQASGQWTAIDGPVAGENAVLYNAQGVLLHAPIINADGSTSSQGYRYVADDGTIVGGQETYGSTIGVAEWTTHDGLTIGQGYTGGALVYDGAVLRLLEPGDTRFIHFHVDGERVAVAIFTPGGAVIFRGTLTDLRELPINQVPVTPPVVVPPPPPPPPPPQEPYMPVAPNEIAVVQAVMAAHPEINRTVDGPFAPNRGGITQLVVQQLGGFPWGRKSKDKSATNLSDDALCYRLQDNTFEIYDIINGDATGSASWGFSGPFADGQNGWFQTITVDAPPVVVVPPTPAPTPDPTQAPPVSVDSLLASLADIKATIVLADQHNVAKLDELKVTVISGIKEAVSALTTLASAGGGLSGILGLLAKKPA